MDGASLGVFRIALGIITSGIGLRYFIKGWHRSHFVEPEFAFSYQGLGWLECHDPWVVSARLVGLILGGLFLAAGVWSRRCAFFLFCLFTWQHLSDKALYLNHYHLLSLLLLSASVVRLDCAFAWRSVSARLGRGIHPAGLIWFRFLISSVYVFAAIAKIGDDWLFRHEPLHTWFLAKSATPGIGPLLAQSSTAAVASWTALFFDLTIPFLVLWRVTRRYAFFGLVVFHLMTEWLFPLGAFPWLMIASASLLLDPSYPRPILRRLGLAQNDTAPADPSPPLPRLSARHRVLVAACGLLLLLMPLRGFLYAGEIHWSESGYRFSWRVMTMEKTGTLQFVVENSEGEFLASIAPESFLTPLQAAMASTQADLIAQAAHEIARREEARRGHPVRVRAYARVSLNGRPSRWLVDPQLDLTTIDPFQEARPWVLFP